MVSSMDLAQAPPSAKRLPRPDGVDPSRRACPIACGSAPLRPFADLMAPLDSTSSKTMSSRSVAVGSGDFPAAARSVRLNSMACSYPSASIWTNHSSAVGYPMLAAPTRPRRAIEPALVRQPVTVGTGCSVVVGFLCKDGDNRDHQQKRNCKSQPDGPQERRVQMPFEIGHDACHQENAGDRRS